ncbi:MAG: NosD domain-containing protein [Nanoarchaeota archaeon]|nr:NosD domain-containing protein [Nanoarchaeota archaeon]
MKTNYRILLVLGLLLLGMNFVSAQTLISSCQDITVPGDYVLANNLVGAQASGFCISINSSGVSLSGSGFSITNDGSGSIGILVTGPITNVHIDGIEVSGYNNKGIAFVQQVTDSSLTNNIVHGNEDENFALSNCNNLVVTANTAYNSQDGFSLFECSGNTLTSNFAYDNSHVGFNIFSNSNNNQFIKNVAYNNGFAGFQYGSSTGNTQSGGEVYGCQIGVFLTDSDNNNVNNVNTHDNFNTGILLDVGSDGNTLSLNTANFNTRGFELSGSSINNVFTNNVANFNNEVGFEVNSVSGNTFTGNTAQENVQFDIFVNANTDADCNNVITTMTCSGGQPCLYFNSAVNLNNCVASEIVLCNADGSTLTDCTVSGSPTLDNNGIFLFRTGGVTLTRVTSSDNFAGVGLLGGSTNNNIVDSVTDNNAFGGIVVLDGTGNTITNSAANNNGQFGVLFFGDNNVLNGNNMCFTATGGTDIANFGNGNIGDENTCDSSQSWNDVGTTGCTFCCGGGDGVGVTSFVDLHIIDMAKRGDCGGAGSCKFDAANDQVRVFNRNDPAFQSLWTKNPSGTLYDEVYEVDVGRVGSCTTDSLGMCTAGSQPGTCAGDGGLTVGDLLVIVKHFDSETGKTIYTGLPLSPEDFKDTNGDSTPDTATKEFQVIKVIKKDGTIEFKGGSKTVVTGSRLEIISPDAAVWSGLDEVYPFLFTSDSEWTVDICLQMPTGYSIVGTLDENGNVVGDSNCAQAFVVGESKVVAFQVRQVGSPEPDGKATLKVKNKKSNAKVVTFDIPGLKDATKKARLAKASKTAKNATGAAIAWEPLSRPAIELSLEVLTVSLLFYLVYRTERKGGKRQRRRR